VEKLTGSVEGEGRAKKQTWRLIGEPRPWDPHSTYMNQTRNSNGASGNHLNGYCENLPVGIIVWGSQGTCTCFMFDRLPNCSRPALIHLSWKFPLPLRLPSYVSNRLRMNHGLDAPPARMPLCTLVLVVVMTRVQATSVPHTAHKCIHLAFPEASRSPTNGNLIGMTLEECYKDKKRSDSTRKAMRQVPMVNIICIKHDFHGCTRMETLKIAVS
jgi:hypothetical protein